MPFWEGFGFGLATAFLIGPVFFTLLKASLDHGARGGVLVALGIIASDILVLIICRTGSVALFHEHVNEGSIAMAAAVVLVVLGVWYLKKPGSHSEQASRLGKTNAIGLIASGFLVNFINPFVFVIWIGFSLRATTLEAEGQDPWVFLVAILIGIFVTDLLKALFAPKLKMLLSPQWLKRLYRVIGVAMLVFSIRLFIHAISVWH